MKFSFLFLSGVNTDAKLPTDVKEILEVAALLDTTEYNIFQLAYDRWFGSSAEDRNLETHFSNYMFNEVVPHWVHHFTRHVLEDRLKEEKEIDPARYGVHEPPVSARTIFFGRVYTIAIALIIIFLFLITLGPEQLFGVSKNCYLLPCY